MLIFSHGFSKIEKQNYLKWELHVCVQHLSKQEEELSQNDDWSTQKYQHNSN